MRIGGPAWRSAIFPDDTPEARLLVSRLATALLGSGAVIGFVAAVFTRTPGYEPRGVLVPTAFAAVSAVGLHLAGSRVPVDFVQPLLAGAVVLISVGVYYSGPLAPEAASLYVWLSTYAFLFVSRRAAAVYVGAAGVFYAWIVVDRGFSAPFSRWLAIFGAVVVTGATVSWLCARIVEFRQAEHEAREEAEQAKAELEIVTRHKSEFLANMSHELRTPLNAVIGFSDVLRDEMFGTLNERQRSYVDDIRTSGEHLLSLINDILDLSKVEAGRMELDRGPFLLAEVLRDGITMVKDRAARTGITLDLDVGGDVEVVDGDERRVKQVVFNLLSNAVKFTPSGGRVDVRAWRENGRVAVAVADTGMGISEEDQARIFEEFEQGGVRRDGTGLGLALARCFVELHGGRIWVESQPGEGSTFTFTIPVR